MPVSCADGSGGGDVAAERSVKARAWDRFDRILAEAAPRGNHSSPWTREDGALRYAPDFRVLARLLAVPLLLRAASTTGVPALALDVWTAYELRRAGLDPDAVWPRARAPRVLPAPVARLLDSLPQAQRAPLEKRLALGVPGVTQASANVLGKNYLKQVDVVMADWDTGPELLISTKRMDSSFGKNAANRVEESYGDAKNLRLRHPLAALGFVYGLRSTILDSEPEKAEWLIDLLGKLGREDDAYHAVALIMIDYEDHLAIPDDGDREDALVAAGLGEPETEIEGQEDLLAILLSGDASEDEIPAGAGSTGAGSTGAGSTGADSAGDEAVGERAHQDDSAGDDSAGDDSAGDDSEVGGALAGPLEGPGEDAARASAVTAAAAASGERAGGERQAPVRSDLPEVRLLLDRVPAELQPARFLALMVDRVLDATPVTRHREARRRRREA